MVSAAFSPLVEQTQAVELLTQAIQRDRLAPAYLFVGPEGVGRKLTARLFLGAVLAQAPSSAPTPTLENHPDVLWVEPTYLHQGKPLTATGLRDKGIALPKGRPQIRLEQVRDITRFLSQAPLEAPRLFVVLDQAQTMGEAAANGLLKTLEEPDHGLLILIAPSLDALLPTIVSRCQRIPFQRLSTPGLQIVLQQLERRDLLQDLPLVRMAQGSPGLALQAWETRQSIPAEVLEICQTPPQSPRACLELAQRIDKTLGLDTQLWLLDYLQQHYWSRGWAAALQPIEQAKTALMQYVQPQLVWDVLWITLSRLSHAPV